MNSRKRSLLSIILAILTVALMILPITVIGASAEGVVTVKFAVASGTTEVASITAASGSTITLPTASAPDGETFVGWSATELKETVTTKPTVYAAGSSYTANANVTLYATYSKTEASNTATIITDVSTLAIGDQIIIAAKDYNAAMSTEQKSNNRGETAIEKNGSKLTITDATQIITVEAGTQSGTYAFNVGGKYLYASSTSNNYLKSGDKRDNASFYIDISQEGEATVIAYTAYGTSNVGWIKYNLTSKLFSCYKETSTQKAIALYEIDAPSTTYYTASGCAHSSTVKSYANATCTEDGYERYTCSACGDVTSETIIPKTNHANKETNVVVNATCLTNGKTVTSCVDCGETLSEKKEPEAIGHDLENGKCLTCGYEIPDTADFSGKYYIAGIRKSGEEFYQLIKSELDNKSRYALEVSDIAANAQFPASIDGKGADAENIFVFEKLSNGKYNIYAEGIEGDAKYLGWTSGNTGEFVTKADALELNVTVSESTGMVNVYFTYTEEDDNGDAKTSTRYLALNTTADYKYAAWYASQMANLALIPIIEEEVCEHTVKISAASVNIGSALSIKYYVTACEHTDISKYAIRFTMNEKVVTVTDYTLAEDGRYIFVFTGIAPQCMGDNIKAELLLGEDVISVKDNYSILTNVTNLLNNHPDNEKLKTLISDLLVYGAAAQEYANYKTDTLVTSGLKDVIVSSDSTPSYDDNDRAISESSSDDVKIIAAGVYFDFNNKIYVKFTANDITNVKLTANGNEIEFESIGNNTYIAFTDAILATEFAKVFSFELKVEDNTVQTLEYSVNSYVYAKWDDVNGETDDPTAMAKLALALYRYGKSAADYN